MVGSYGFIEPDSCAGVSFTIAMALLCQIAVRAYCLRGLYFVVPYSCAGVSLMGAMALSHQSCADESGR